MTPARSDETKKTSTRGRKPRVQSPQVEKHIEENARHISENTRDIQTNTKMIHILYSVIILLMIIIAWLAFWLGSIFSGNDWWTQNWAWSTNEVSRTWEWVIVTLLDDSRCNDCVTNEIRQQLQQSPFLSQAEFRVRDFSESWVEEFLLENNITHLPQVLFNTNELWDGGQISPFLTPLSNWEFRLEIGEAASFDPFASRSERGFLIVDAEILQTIEANSFVNWDPEAPITWLEYSDFGCTFCIKMRTEDKTVKNILNDYDWVVNSRFLHMAFRNREVPEVIECIAEQAGAQAYHTLIDEWLNARITTKAEVFEVADANGINYNTQEVDACIASDRMKAKIDDTMELGQNVFGIRGTPGNILINVNTGEYELVSWAYPQSYFEEVIERLR